MAIDRWGFAEIAEHANSAPFPTPCSKCTVVNVMTANSNPAAPTSNAPAKSGRILTALILGAGVANMNLAVANVGLPQIGEDLGATQTGLNLVAMGFSLGLAATVLYLGAIGDRYGRKNMLLLGLILGIPAAIMSALAPSIEVLAVSRVLGGFAAGMAYPTTLALITALWSGSSRTRAIALWSALGAAMSAMSPLLAGAILMFAPWGWAFVIAIPFALPAIYLVWKEVPAHINETSEKVDHIGGVLSAIFIGALVLGINFVSLPDEALMGLVTLAVALVSGVAFFWRQATAGEPLFDLTYARRATFWVAAVSGIIVFGSLMGAMFIGQQFLQNVMSYNTFEAGLAILPCVIAMVVAAPFSSGLITRFGSRWTLLIGFALCTVGFLCMYLFWTTDTPLAAVVTSYAFIGAGVGIAGTPASHSLTASVPVTRVGMASGTGDLQRDLGGAIMQSLLGAILGASYAASVASDISDAPASVQSQITSTIGNQLRASYGSAADVAKQFPQYQDAIVAAARHSFLDGSDAAYLAGIVAMLIGAALTWFFYPRKDREEKMFAQYAAEHGE